MPNSSEIAVNRDDSPRHGLQNAILPALLIWTFLLACDSVHTWDVWWHLRTGRWIAENRSIPVFDLYTYTNSGQAWTNLHWVFQVVIWQLYDVGGLPLLVVFKAGCLTLCIALCWQAAGKALPPTVKALCFLPAVIALSKRSLVRPEVLTFVLMAAWLLIFEVQRSRPRLRWLLPATMILWVNCHGLFVLGLVIGAAFAVDRLVTDWAAGRENLALIRPVTRQTEGGPSVTSGCYFCLFVLLACLVNPYFEEGALFPLTLFRKFSSDRALYAEIGEFQMPLDYLRQHGVRTLANIYFAAELIVLALSLISFLVLLAYRKLPVGRLLLFIAFLYLAALAMRNTVPFAIVAVYVCCANFGDVATLRRELANEKTAGQGTRRGFRASLAVVLLLGVLSVSVVSGLWERWMPGAGTFGFYEQPDRYLHRAVQFAGRPGMPKRAVVVPLHHAGEYIFHNGPDRKVHIDNRLEVASKETFRNQVAITRLMVNRNPAWQNLIGSDSSGPPVVIISGREPWTRMAINGVLLTPNWVLVYADRLAAVFVHATVARRLRLKPADITSLRQSAGN